MRQHVLLSVQHALIGEITAQVRFVAVHFDEAGIRIIVWHDGTMSEADRAEFEGNVISQVTTLNARRVGVSNPPVELVFVVSFPPLRPAFRGTLVYGRKEPHLSGCSC